MISKTVLLFPLSFSVVLFLSASCDEVPKHAVGVSPAISPTAQGSGGALAQAKTVVTKIDFEPFKML